MSVRSILIRSVAVAAVAGGGLATVQHLGLGAGAGQAQVTSVVLTGATERPGADMSRAGAAMPDMAVPEFVTRGPSHAQTLIAVAEPVATPVALSPLGLPCGLSVTAEAIDRAMVALDIIDACAPDARLTITHGPLSFTARTDAMGIATLDIPALETPAFFTVHLDTGAEATTLAGVPDLVDHDRVAITWAEDRGLQLHAFEDGATYGGAGHIWQDAPGSENPARDGGFLTLLGDATVEAPRLAHVYTLPQSGRDDLILSVEVPITEGNCGRPVRAETLQVRPGGQIETRPVTLILPGCDTVGEFLLLQNLFTDLRLASN